MLLDTLRPSGLEGRGGRVDEVWVPGTGRLGRVPETERGRPRV